MLINSSIVHAAVPANTFAIYGNGEDKELTELVPGILKPTRPGFTGIASKARGKLPVHAKEGGRGWRKEG